MKRSNAYFRLRYFINNAARIIGVVLFSLTHYVSGMTPVTGNINPGQEYAMPQFDLRVDHFSAQGPAGDVTPTRRLATYAGDLAADPSMAGYHQANGDTVIPLSLALANTLQSYMHEKRRLGTDRAAPIFFYSQSDERSFFYVFDALLLAIEYGNDNAVHTLLRLGYNFVLPENFEKFPLHLVSSMTNLGVAALGKIKNLQTVTCSGSKFDSVEGLKSLSSLQELNLAGARCFAGKGLVALAHLPIKELNLSNTAASDQTFYDLFEFALSDSSSIFRCLNRLYLSNTEVTDAVFEVLGKMSSLGTLILTGTNVTKEGIERFRRNRPHVKVVCHNEYMEDPIVVAPCPSPAPHDDENLLKQTEGSLSAYKGFTSKQLEQRYAELAAGVKPLTDDPEVRALEARLARLAVGRI